MFSLTWPIEGSDWSWWTAKFDYFLSGYW